MSMEKQKTGQLGVNVVERVVIQDWGGRWQPIDSVNDDGIDGLIFLESSNGPTGQIIYAQVKCTKARINSDGRVPVVIASKKLRKNMNRWQRVVGAAILIHIDPETLRPTWVNLRSPSAIGNNQVYVPLENQFDGKSRKAIAALCGKIHRDITLKNIETERSDFEYLSEKTYIQASARKQYKNLGAQNLCISGCPHPLRFTREGWHHITRSERSKLTRLQSFQLLGAIPKIISKLSESDFIEVKPKAGFPVEFAYLIAAVSFPFRQTGVVKIVFRKRGVSGSANYSFHTVYEPRRRRNILGG